MSKLSDYSKFDHIDSDDESEADQKPTAASDSTSSAQSTAATAPVPAIASGTTKKHPTIPDRYVFSYSGQKIYEWEQSLEEVTIYIDAPPQLPTELAATYIIVNINPNRLQVGLKGNDRFFIDEDTFDKVKVKESSWFLDEGVITIVLAKGFRGQTWEGVLRGHKSSQNSGEASRPGIQESVDPFVKQEMQRTLMLERFQEENPGFDFRDASFNGEVPDPRTFMGGVGYNH
ncbi:hypothetical protein HJC23_002356 [Cyclotella cryptica]|uniref:CS domain-containing protein n=1 Tax=Cyclotella cryptica TaxID=29204 RepID=A0ABD3QKS5_9STRA|eukprot:CCRYP_004451-RA/>CCRYP_004451-RA protein AED:0.37 eAED:0.37 QI:0/-1/0/1/-1/1/1/0/230